MENEDTVIMLDKQINIQGTVEDFNMMILEACGIRNVPLKPLYGRDRLIVDVLFHKKRKALCYENNPRYRLTRIYS